MKAIILNASAWMIVPVMDAFAKHLTATMPVLQITWARYFFTGKLLFGAKGLFYNQLEA